MRGSELRQAVWLNTTEVGCASRSFSEPTPTSVTMSDTKMWFTAAVLPSGNSASVDKVNVRHFESVGGVSCIGHQHVGAAVGRNASNRVKLNAPVAL